MDFEKAIRLKGKIEETVLCGDDDRGHLRIVSEDRCDQFRVYGFTDDGDDFGNRGPNYGGLYGDSGRIFWFDTVQVQKARIAESRDEYCVAFYLDVMQRTPSSVKVGEMWDYSVCEYEDPEEGSA